MGFKQHLDSLKLSSKEAIADGEKDSLSDLKKYLHIERTVESDLSDMIINADASKTSELILLLGNVGDGKSHLLAKMWEIHPREMTGLNVYNDATESISKNKSYLQNLFDIFDYYSDKNLESGEGNRKTIIAINLGTITNFLEEAGSQFSRLKIYVEESHLIDSYVNLNKNNKHPYFQSLNLTDYHIFSLEESGAQCQVLLDILNKITQKNNNNPFFKLYQEYYSNHPVPSNCPMKYNFDLLSQERVQLALSEVLIKVILTDNLIVSVRLLMNWIYDLIVPPEFSNLSDDEILNRTKKSFNSQDFYKKTLPCLLFDSQATSVLLKYISQYEPVNVSEEQDEVVIKLGTITEAKEYFNRYKILDKEDALYKTIDDLNVENRIQLFLRLHYIFQLRDGLKINDSIFKNFISNLYSFNSGQTKKLLELYKQVQTSIYLWNGVGNSEPGYINTNIGRKQSTYSISQKLNLEYFPVKLAYVQLEVLEKFSKNIILSFKLNSDSDVFSLEVDYKLYQLIIKINNGYRPNRIDKRTHVKFTQFVNKLTNYESQTKELVIQQFNGETQKKFKLSFLAGFDDFEFIEI